MRLLLSLACLIAVGSTTSDIPEPKEKKLAHASNDLAFNLLRAYKNEKNVFISPFSISTALAMVYVGARGITAETMRNVLKYNQYGLSEQEMNEAFKAIADQAKQNTQEYKFSSYNSALIQNDFVVTTAYQDALRQFYSADISSVDFANEGEQVKARINGAAENATHGKIKDLLSETPDPATKLFLLNAVYFLGNWKNPFDPHLTSERTFYNNGAEEKRVPTMELIDGCIYSDRNDLNATVIVLPYKGENSARMIIVHPNEGTNVAELQEKITSESLDRALESVREEGVDLNVPKFNMSFSTNMVDSLTSLGLGNLFSNVADLSGIAGNALKVSYVIHKAVIEVNEKGSEAAGSTGIGIVPLSLHKIISVNHPFIFFIRDDSSGMILFSGRVDEL